MEIWKTIPGFENYQISNYGNVKSITRFVVLYHGGVCQKPERLLKQQNDKQGYKVVTLKQNGIQKNKTIHRLVATIFINNPSNLPEVNHEDGIKSNNHYSNLTWCTRLENQNHAVLNGLITPASTETLRNSHSLQSKPVIAVNITDPKNRYKFDTIGSAVEWLRKNGWNKAGDANIILSAKTNIRTAYGFRWEYVK